MTEALGQLGEYQLLHELKSGGMGKIYLARKLGSRGFEKLVAIKTILGEFSTQTDAQTMFMDEARLLSRLDHPAVAQVHDFGEVDGVLYLAMEYIAGVRFGELMELSVPVPMMIGLFSQVCRALHAAHQLQDIHGEALHIVHRDVSPDNLMLSFAGHVKVLDFGIALIRGRQAPVTQYGTVKGKPPYLSPEQVRGERLDRRSDIWSVGVVLWEMLAGQHLFDGDSIYSIAKAVEEQVLVAPSEVCGPLPGQLDTIVAKALCRDLTERYQSAEEMAIDLEELAIAIAAPSTSAFAGGLLSERRTAHRQWLRRILVGEESERVVPKGRPVGLATAPRDVDAPIAELETIERGEDNRGKWWIGAALLAAIVGLGMFFLRGSEGESQRSSRQDAGGVLVVQNEEVVLKDAGLSPADTAVVVADAALPPSVPTTVRKPKKKRGKRIVKPEPKSPVLPSKPISQPSPAVVEFGTITVAAEPYALIRVDGKEIGSTPIFKRKLAAGTHTVELIHPASGKVRLSKTIELQPKGHKNIIAR